MHLVKVNLARSIWLFDTGELNPRGATIGPLFNELIRRYHFTGYPKVEDFRHRKDLLFSDGTYITDSKQVRVELEILADGLIANTTHSTEASDEFLTDFIGWATSKLESSDPVIPTGKKLCRSELVIQANHGLIGVCGKLDEFAKALRDETDGDQEPSAIIFGSEKQTSSFTFERRINEPFTSNRFFSAAMIQTKTHLSLLERLEKVFTEEPV